MPTIYIGEPPITHQFYKIYCLKPHHWVVCLAGRQGLETRYFKPFKETFPTKSAALKWRKEILAKSPYDYWIAPEGKYLLDYSGNLKPCHKTEKIKK